MEDQTKRGMVKGVLIFSALVIGVISLYTTFLVFAAPAHIALSPGDYVKVKNETNSTNSSGPGEESFVIDDGDDIDEFASGGGGDGGGEFSTDTLPGDDNAGQYTGLINPLVVYEEVRVGKPGRGQFFMFLAILEIVVIYFVYRRVEGNFIKGKS